MKEQQERIAKLVKETRKGINELSIKKLTTLDCGDRYLVIRKLEELNRQVNYLTELGNARCSVVLEMVDYLTNQMDTHKEGAMLDAMIHDGHAQGICPYCDQPLDGNTINGLHAACNERYSAELNQAFPEDDDNGRTEARLPAAPQE